MLSDIVRRFKRQAEALPPAVGDLPDGDMTEALQADNVQLLMLDSRGRVFTVHGGTLSGGTIVPLKTPRSSVITLLDTFDVQDSHGLSGPIGG